MFKELRFLFKKPRSVQEIFDAVIDGGFYTERKDAMCISLWSACLEGVISKKEKEIASRAIRAYLEEYVFLDTKLHNNGLPYEFSDRLAIYRSWANRPSLE